MSVIRQPGMLGRTTRRRLVGVTAALTTAALETLAVVSWFGLVSGSPSASTALGGLGILFCGSLLRTGIFGRTVGELGDLLQPPRVGAALALTGGWVLWLFVADAVGGRAGVVAGTVVLVVVLTGQLSLERRAFSLRAPRSVLHPLVALVVPALLLAAGGAVLLASAQVADWTVVSPPLSLEVTTVVVQIDAIQLGAVGFALCAVLAHQWRFQRTLDP
ncbi:hypothetical protein [Halopiger goleimassiliensis]|uniref:hypothetical protein n=1 Tax=Halopiger goleimassiliensis TaxID=1293048 RepID=UPI000677F893|nr:hypothetical protein [Halopiger goleimassiliensis]